MFSFCCSNKTVISCDQLFCCHNNAYNIITISKLLYQRNQNTKSDKDIIETRYFTVVIEHNNSSKICLHFMTINGYVSLP